MVQAFSAREVREAIKKSLRWHSGLYPVFTGPSGVVVGNASSSSSNSSGPGSAGASPVGGGSASSA